MRSRVLNALAQHIMNTQALLQICRGTYECARLTVNLHVSCTIYMYVITMIVVIVGIGQKLCTFLKFQKTTLQ